MVPASRLLRIVAAALLVAGCAAVSRTTEAPPMTDTLSLTSTAFDEGDAIPMRHTCDGEDVSPALEWSGAPDGTASFALVVDDPDARDFVHWAVAGVPADRTSLNEGEVAGTQGRNDFGRVGWGGPCPPTGSHRYVFTIYALSEDPRLSEGFSADELRRAIDGITLGSGQLAGTYRRGG